MLNEKGREIAAALAEIPEVKQVAKPPAIATTQNHYGHYASVIQTLAGATGRAGKEGHFLAAEALILAGANRKGVEDAMFAFYGYAEYDSLNRMLAGI